MVIYMNITIISVGKIKEKYLKNAIREYSKRLSRYCKLKYIEVSDEKAPENLSEAEMENIKDKEGEGILKSLKDGTYVIALDIEGKMMSSEEFAEKLDKLAIQGRSDVTFIIGGSLGLSKDVLKRADFRLSFSPMTFPHQLMKVILLEQIYRGFRINRGEPYHK
ncbi:MAG: rRNA (pseudouridine1915-N3)-methyltransferase [Candidatus Petromonas sp.]|jgi:23S rRNA (pseudouridine1915-N3)-methyltransferase|nr:rRNA (pseudouridine1915-N3)-methyltransferase [Candidatus Petromonas sp.]